jgi:phenylacetate-CoA ligase
MGARIQPSLIFTSSELLDDWTRRKIETTFQSEVLDVYGCSEVKEIAWECPQHKGYHVNADWLFVEFVREENEGTMEAGPILVTSLYNYGMPLIRYEIGDTGRFIEGLCPCGRGLPLMARAQGRRVDYFTLPNQSMVSPYKMTCAIEHIGGMKQYQIVQKKIDRVELKVVPMQGFDEKRKRELKQVLEQVLPGIKVEVRTVDGIKREKSGKYKIVLSHVQI